MLTVETPICKSNLPAEDGRHNAMDHDPVEVEIAQVLDEAHRHHDHDKLNQHGMVRAMIESLSTTGGVAAGRQTVRQFDDGSWSESHGTTEAVAALKTLQRVPS